MISLYSKEPLAEKGWQKIDELLKKNKNERYEVHPIVYLNDGEIFIGGVTKVRSSKGTRVGEFRFDFPNGKQIIIPDVLDFSCGYKTDNKFKPYNATKHGALGILEEEEIESINFYILQFRKMLRGKEPSSVLFFFDLHIYHGPELVEIIHNVGRNIMVSGPMNFSYTNISKHSDNIFDHIIYNNGDKKIIDTTAESSIKGAYRKQKEIIESKKSYSIFDPDGFVKIYFFIDGGKASYVLKEFCKEADFLLRLDNCFDDDDTVNYLVKYKPERIEDLAFVEYCLAKGAYGGSAIYNCPLHLYYLGIKEQEFPLASEKWMYTDQQIEAYTAMVKDLFEKYGEAYRPNKLPDKISYEQITSAEQYISLKQFLEKTHPAYIDTIVQPAKQKIKSFKEAAKAYDEDNAKIRKLREQFKETYTHIYQELLVRGEVGKRWKSEFNVFTTAQSLFSDAIYQYHPRWLKNQSLDIFIPSMNIGIEYQGIQHFQPIEIFGGETGYVKRLALDEKKRQLCLENNVKLIEWHYEEPINPVVLKSKLAKLT